MKISPFLIGLIVLLLAMLAACASVVRLAFAADASKPTFEQAVSLYYRSVAVLNSHQISWEHQIQEDTKTVAESLNAMKKACDGTLEGVDEFQPTCKPVDKPKAPPTGQ